MHRLSSRGRKALEQLVYDVHPVLSTEPEVSKVHWFREADMDRAKPPSASSPDKP